MLAGVRAEDATVGTPGRIVFMSSVSGRLSAPAPTTRPSIALEAIAEAVDAALTAPRPEPRYAVGTDARPQLALRGALPTRAFDATIARLTSGR